MSRHNCPSQIAVVHRWGSGHGCVLLDVVSVEIRRCCLVHEPVTVPAMRQLDRDIEKFISESVSRFEREIFDFFTIKKADNKNQQRNNSKLALASLTKIIIRLKPSVSESVME